MIGILNNYDVKQPACKSNVPFSGPWNVLTYFSLYTKTTESDCLQMLPGYGLFYFKLFQQKVTETNNEHKAFNLRIKKIVAEGYKIQ